jgi:hypothetical protein
MSRQNRIQIIQEIERIRGSKVFCYLTSDRPNASVQIDKDILPKFIDQLKINNEYKKIDLFIFTLGGDTLAGFGLSRLLREYTDYVSALVPHKCYSAGTLFALGANEIVMTKGATLSPIDPSITRPLNPAVQLQPNQPPQLIPLSVESVAGFRSLAKEEWNITSKEQITNIFSLLASKVHPVALGDVYRIRQQIDLLASELLHQHRNDKANIKKIVRLLSKELGSHDYLIFRKEALKIFGSQIRIDSNIEKLIWDLYLDFQNEMELGIPFDLSIKLSQLQTPSPQTPRSTTIELKLALIESSESGDKAIQKINVTEQIIPQPNGQIVRIPNHEVVFSGWERYS